MANRNDEYGREQQSSTYGRSGSDQDPERGQSRTGSQRYQAQNQSPQDSQQNPYRPTQPRYQSQGQQSQGGEVYQGQRYGAGRREYGSDDGDSQRHETQGRGHHQMYGRGEQFNEFDERAQSWEQERGSDYSPGSYASQEFGQGRQQATGQRGQQYPSGQGGSYRSESLGYGAGSSGGRMAGEGYGSSSGYGGGMSGEYGAQSRGEQFLRPGDTQSSVRSGMSGGVFGGSDYGTSGLGTSSSTRGRGYTGVGPKNYSRSDERIREDLCERLTQDDDIDASEIEVKAEQGLVTLEGAVEQRWMKHRVEDIADSCSGVRQVDNRIRVQGSEYGSSGYGKSAQSRTGTGKTSTGTTSTTTTPSSGTTPH